MKTQINRILSDLKQNGTIENIVKNYIGDETKGKFPFRPAPETETPQGTLKVATSATFPPYEYYSDAEIVGIDMDLAKALAERLGRRLIIEDMEFDAIVSAVQSGKADLGIAGMSVTADRLKNVDFTNPYTESKQVIIIRAQNAPEERDTSLTQRFKTDFITDSRWKYLAIGLGHTLLITALAVLIGIILAA